MAGMLSGASQFRSGDLLVLASNLIQVLRSEVDPVRPLKCVCLLIKPNTLKICGGFEWLEHCPVEVGRKSTSFTALSLNSTRSSYDLTCSTLVTCRNIPTFTSTALSFGVVPALSPVPTSSVAPPCESPTNLGPFATSVRTSAPARSPSDLDTNLLPLSTARESVEDCDHYNS